MMKSPIQYPKAFTSSTVKESHYDKAQNRYRDDEDGQKQ